MPLAKRGRPFSMTSLRSLRHPIVLALFAVLAGPVSGLPTLYYSPTQLSNGLGGSSSNLFTTAVSAAFGAGNVIQIADFANAASFAGGDALFINPRSTSSTLSAAEQTNISAFIAGGGAVFFVGEHASWTNWDNSFLNLFGDQFLAWNGVNAALATSALPSQFAPNSQIGLAAPGAIGGGNGTALFTAFSGGGGRRMAALYGPNQNAIAFLDSNAFGLTTAGQQQFYAGVSNWLYTVASAHDVAENTPPTAPVPDSGVTLALGGVLLVLVAQRRRG